MQVSEQYLGLVHIFLTWLLAFTWLDTTLLPRPTDWRTVIPRRHSSTMWRTVTYWQITSMALGPHTNILEHVTLSSALTPVSSLVFLHALAVSCFLSVSRCITWMKKWTRLRGWMNEQQQEGCESNNPIFTHRFCPFLWASDDEVLRRCYFSVDGTHRSTREFEFCPSLLCWSMRRRIMARVASGVVFNQVYCALLPYSASNFWLILYVWYLLYCCLCLIFTKSTVNQVTRCRGGCCDSGGVGMHTRLGMIRQKIDMFFNPLSALHFYLVR